MERQIKIIIIIITQRVTYSDSATDTILTVQQNAPYYGKQT